MKKTDLNFIRSEEQFLIWLINHMADSFGSKGVLRGGMVLRLLDSPRATHDLDYAFTELDSKKEIVSHISKALKDFNEIMVEHTLHSTNVRFDLRLKNDNGQFHVVLEANVIKNCPAVAISTGVTAQKHHLEPKLILTMRHDISLANKLAAWVERRLVRDLYDAYYFYRFLGVRPDIPTLSARLGQLNYADKRYRKSSPKALSLEGFCELLSSELSLLDEKAIASGLPNLEPNQLPGLDLKIRSALLEMVDWIVGK